MEAGALPGVEGAACGSDFAAGSCVPGAVGVDAGTRAVFDAAGGCGLRVVLGAKITSTSAESAKASNTRVCIPVEGSLSSSNIYFCKLADSAHRIVTASIQRMAAQDAPY